MRKTIADIAIETLTKEGQTNNIPRHLWAVTYGDGLLIHEIARRAGMKSCHPLELRKRVLDALGRDVRFEKRYFTGRSRFRMMYLKPGSEGKR